MSCSLSRRQNPRQIVLLVGLLVVLLASCGAPAGAPPSSAPLTPESSAPVSPPPAATRAARAEIVAREQVGDRQLTPAPTLHLYGRGTHNWVYWERELHRAWPLITESLGLQGGR